MKQFITGMGCVLVLMALISQFAQNQILCQQIFAMQYEVEQFDEAVSQEKQITEESRSRLKERLCRIFHCSASEILLTEEEKIVQGKRIVRYQVQAPIKKILAAPAFWGVEVEQNRGSYKMKGEFLCE